MKREFVAVGALALGLAMLGTPAEAAADPGGHAVAWGINDSGQLGDATMTDQTVPGPVVAPVQDKQVSAVTGGYWHSCAIADAAAYCWGNNLSGQLGSASGTASTVPVAVNAVWGAAPVTSISAGYGHTCAIVDTALYCWGQNSAGQLGTGAGPDTDVPAMVTGPWGTAPVTAVSAGWQSTCAIADQSAYCWGRNKEGQLGVPGPNSPTPVAVDTSAWGSQAVTQIAVGWWHACAVVGGSAYCWGFNDVGQLGDPSTLGSKQFVPVPVQSPGAWAGKPVGHLATGYWHTCATVDNQAYCWGSNGNGQLGDNSTVERDEPTAVAAGMGSATIIGLTGGYAHTCAVAGGTVFCWGLDAAGPVVNSGADVLAPVAVRTGGLSGKTAFRVAAGGFFTLSTAAAPPSVPLDPTAVAGDATVTVDWKVPATDGGSPLTGYKVTASPGGHTCETVALACTFSGLTNGTEYTFAIIAKNAAGDSAPAMVKAMPRTVPTVVRNVAAEPGRHKLTLTWEVPASDGGAAITGYRVTDGNGVVVCETSERTCAVTGLRTGVAYTYTVVALNAVGDSPAVSVTGRPAAKRVQEPRDAKGKAPRAIKLRGTTVITGPNARTNAGELIRTRVRCAPHLGAQARGQVRITVVQFAPATSEYKAFRARTVYVHGAASR